MVDGRKRVWRRRGERFADYCVTERDRWVTGIILVWPGMTSNHRTDVFVLRQAVNVQRYRNEVLRLLSYRSCDVIFPHSVFQHDNALPYTARVATDFLRINHVNVIDSPSLSPDLAPIEHLWDKLGRRVYARQPPSANVNQLQCVIVQEWQQIPQRKILAVTLLIRRR